MENKENNNSENISSLKKEEEENKMETENVENIEEHEPLTTKVFFVKKKYFLFGLFSFRAVFILFIFIR